MKRAPVRDLLVEIGTEELPAAAQEPLAAALTAGLTAALDERGIAPAETRSFSSPRRLAALARGVPETEPERLVERRGPSLAAAFDKAGRPTRAAEGFARTVGAAVGALETFTSNEGAWLVHRHREGGRATTAILGELLPAVFAALPLPRRMRWGAGEAAFLRPVQWLLIRYGTETPSVQAFGLTAGGESRGHRFHHRGPVIVESPGEYPAALRAAYVIADADARRAEIERLIAEAALAAGATPALPIGLAAEITGMVEWPVALTAHFDPKYLALPEPVLVTTLAHHQRFVPLRNADGTLANAFVAIANLASREPERLRQGLERVVRPRLDDAAFYYRRDRGRALGDYAADLEGLAFGAKLGTMAEKSRRLECLARDIAPAVGADAKIAARAGALAKCDLVTGLVFEFPELQGIMGGHYAAASGEHDAVAAAIAEQYLPAGADDALPQTPAGVALALADRLDTLVGGFAAGFAPTGAKDPFGLRRAAFGLLRIAAERATELDLAPRLETAATLYPQSLDVSRTLPTIRDFLRERLRSLLLEQGYAADLTQAVLTVAPLAPAALFARAAALGRFRERPEADALAAANKRIANILRQADPAANPSPSTAQGPVNSNLSNPPREERTASADSAPGETALEQALTEVESELSKALASRDFDTALGVLAGLRGPVDRFFDEVLVMDPDPALRARRLGLLERLRKAFLEVADIGELQNSALT